LQYMVKQPNLNTPSYLFCALKENSALHYNRAHFTYSWFNSIDLEASNVVHHSDTFET